MVGFVASNTVSSVEKRLAVNRAVLESIGNREGGWRVSIDESLDKRVWKITVKGPNGYHWTLDFEGKARTPSRVASSIRGALEKADEELAKSLAELVKEGIMFTRELRPDGKVEYVIDRIRLSSDDIEYLRSHGALSRRGIKQYLVARG